VTTIDREGLLLFLGNWFDEYLSFFFFVWSRIVQRSYW
jgi:hypothetical protein